MSNCTLAGTSKPPWRRGNKNHDRLSLSARSYARSQESVKQSEAPLLAEPRVAESS